MEYPAGFGHYRIAIDPGHGGQNEGAKSVWGEKEKYYTMLLSRMLNKRLLRSGHFDVVLVRNGDIELKPSERARIVADAKVDAMVSIHFNSGPFDDQKGFSMIWSRTPKYEENVRFAAHLANAFIDRGFTPDKRLGPSPEYAEPENKKDYASKRDYMAVAKVRGIYEDRTQYIGLLRRGRIPTVLVECGYLSNYFEATLIKVSRTHKEKLAAAIEEGIVSFFAENERIRKRGLIK